MKKETTIKHTVIMLGMALMLAMAGLLSGCNRQVIDVTYSYERAIICLPNGEVVEGKVQSWKDYENSDQIQVKIDGKQYLVHSEDVVLISE